MTQAHPADHSSGGPAGNLLAGRYEFLEPIGHGGMSTIYRGRDLGRAVAIKIIRQDPAMHQDREHLRERFRREAANAARIPPHPNVVQIHDYGTDPEGDRDFIVLELLDGQDLKAVVRERSLDTSTSVRILLEAARGVAAGHRVGIVHRDVKPANLLLTGTHCEGPAKILDFGISKALEGDPEDDLTQAGNVPHTPAYASPEQQMGNQTLSPASDVYQLGLVAYELFTGERAFDAYDRERIGRGERVLPRAQWKWQNVPLPLRAVVERALQVDPKQRYPDAVAFAEALAGAWDDGETLVAAPMSEDATSALGPAPQYGSGATPSMLRGRWHALPTAGRIALAAAAVLLLLAAFQVGGGNSAEGDRVPERSSIAEMEEQFAPLYPAAAERLADESRE